MPKGAMSPVRKGNTKVKRAKVQGGTKIAKTRGASGKHGSGYGKGR
jgi:hypothetical protein